MVVIGVFMCLYYLFYNQDVMERVCMYFYNVLFDVVNYILWLMECFYVLGCCYVIMFFLICFLFWVVLEFFDCYDGFCCLVNLISILEILNLEDQGVFLSDDEIFVSC